MPSDKRKVPEHLDNALLDAAAAVLDSLGWRVAVIGGLAIEQRAEGPNHFQLTVKFTARKPKDLPPAYPV